MALGHHEEWGRLLRISAQAERDWTLGIGPVFRQPGWGPLCPCLRPALSSWARRAGGLSGPPWVQHFDLEWGMREGAGEQRVQEWVEAFIASLCIAGILKDFMMYQIKRESTKENGISL